MCFLGAVLTYVRYTRRRPPPDCRRDAAPLVGTVALCGVGLLFAGVPVAGLWILLILVLAVMQLPPLIVLLPCMIWAFNNMDTTPAVIFTGFIWIIAISLVVYARRLTKSGVLA